MRGEKKEITKQVDNKEITQQSTETRQQSSIQIENKNIEEKKEEKRSSLLDIFRYREIKESDIEEFIDELRYQLLESDVSYEVTEKILNDLKTNLIGKKVKRSEDLEEIITNSLKKSIEEILTKNKFTNIIDEIKKSSKPYVIIFFGINGVGKTTTIAKFAYLLKKNNISSIIAAADTFRAAAQEQLAVHAKNLEIPIIRAKYGADPAAVAYDAIQAAKSRSIDVVLIDTAGRMHTDSDLTNELKRILKIAKPNLRILVLDSLSGNDALQQAKYFENNVGFDLVILTKVDADTKGGIVLSLAYELNKPVVYLGIGQSYDSLVPFSADWFVQRLFS
ncbi:MAG: signal recognition particle-docking protein FtsY [Saccharolobus sp.]